MNTLSFFYDEPKYITKLRHIPVNTIVLIDFFFSQQHQNPTNKLQHSKSGQNLRGSSNGHDSSMNASPPRVHFSDNKENLPNSKVK